MPKETAVEKMARRVEWGKAFPGRVAVWIEKTGTTRNELARQSGVHKGVLARYAAGQIVPATVTIAKIDRVFARVGVP